MVRDREYVGSESYVYVMDSKNKSFMSDPVTFSTMLHVENEVFDSFILTFANVV